MGGFLLLWETGGVERGGSRGRRRAVQYAPPARHHAAQCAVAAHGSRREAARDATLGPP